MALTNDDVLQMQMLALDTRLESDLSESENQDVDILPNDVAFYTAGIIAVMYAPETHEPYVLLGRDQYIRRADVRTPPGSGEPSAKRTSNQDKDDDDDDDDDDRDAVLIDAVKGKHGGSGSGSGRGGSVSDERKAQTKHFFWSCLSGRRGQVAETPERCAAKEFTEETMALNFGNAPDATFEGQVAYLEHQLLQRHYVARFHSSFSEQGLDRTHVTFLVQMPWNTRLINTFRSMTERITDVKNCLQVCRGIVARHLRALNNPLLDPMAVHFSYETRDCFGEQVMITTEHLMNSGATLVEGIGVCVQSLVSRTVKTPLVLSASNASLAGTGTTATATATAPAIASQCGSTINNQDEDADTHGILRDAAVSSPQLPPPPPPPRLRMQAWQVHLGAFQAAKVIEAYSYMSRAYDYFAALPPAWQRHPVFRVTRPPVREIWCEARSFYIDSHTPLLPQELRPTRFTSTLPQCIPADRFCVVQVRGEMLEKTGLGLWSLPRIERQLQCSQQSLKVRMQQFRNVLRRKVCVLLSQCLAALRGTADAAAGALTTETRPQPLFAE